MARSLIAGVNALFRREERRFPPVARVLEDPLAALLVEHRPVVWTIRLLRHLVPPLGRSVEELRTAHLVRHAAVDALTREALAAGYRQVVALGAGYETRAWRLGGGSRWFEVDRPEILARKESRLRGRTPASPRVPVPADLSDPGLPERLIAAGWRPDAPTVIVGEGLLHYLSRPVVAALLRGLSIGGPRRWVLTCIEPDMVGRASGTFHNLVRAVREIPETFLRPEELAALAPGLRLMGAWRYPEQVARFAPAAATRPVGLSQCVVLLEQAADGAGSKGRLLSYRA